ncbi:glycoside hydrolase family 43 protein [Flavobacterium chungbukense]|uniref:Glycoside hydrolase family 43 protein n=1 Tax=Flavobacterium chungbukense TaxID=877464 RepID=A0ABP7XPF0_9FLAO|nr:glycoside hydrolase family 43 protein [Flavobacterium chungbukense]MCC4920854.1 glycoside hydrolase family 43 protein [Flavobacterium chungbukense]
MKKIVSMAALLCVFAACSQEKNTDKPKETKSKAILLADPTIFYNNGLYYLYGTTSEDTPIGEGFQVYTSSDLKAWKDPSGAQNGLALKKGDAFGDKGFWAPQVLSYNNKFYMIYTANENIAVAVSDSPIGPFKSESKEPIIKTGNQIDPFIFIDEDGKKYLYHVRLTNGNRIFVAEINDDLKSIKPETLTECISGTLTWENTQNVSWPVTEGPTVLKHNGLYYMIYSANDFRNPDYAVGYATAKSPLGPWEKATESPIISRKEVGLNGVGHGDVFYDKNGKMKYVLHAHYSNNGVSPRKAATIDIDFEGNKIKANAKSFTLLQE